ncbi:MAG: HD domain-containing protein [Planctomycetia bacterium]|nr:HD domain-containing protein [Planctomycetia bacterium]
MAKPQHEIRDPIHGFIRLTTEERKVLDSRPLQRLRYIHQLAMAYLVYPGATHRRFEHSLGVMELAGRVFDVVTNADNLQSAIARDIVGSHKSRLDYWRQVVRLAALCHDIGHLPFSHAAEDLLPPGWKHERITDGLITGSEMKSFWDDAKVQAEDVTKLAIGPKEFGPKKHRTVEFTPWERILSEIIVGDAFGVDRMDYLLRDSYHAGVAYGRFDHLRLIDTLRILPHPENEDEPLLGIEEGGIHAAEALLMARFFMYKQVYFHDVRRAYDYHLTEFLKQWLKPEGRFPTGPTEHLARSDNEVLAAITLAASDRKLNGHIHAARIVNRKHFRLIYERNPIDRAVNVASAKQIESNLAGEFGAENVHYFTYLPKSNSIDFPVLLADGRAVSSVNLSELLNRTPPVSVEFVFIAPEQEAKAKKHLAKHKDEIIKPCDEKSE